MSLPSWSRHSWKHPFQERHLQRQREVSEILMLSTWRQCCAGLPWCSKLRSPLAKLSHEVRVRSIRLAVTRHLIFGRPLQLTCQIFRDASGIVVGTLMRVTDGRNHHDTAARSLLLYLAAAIRCCTAAQRWQQALNLQCLLQLQL